MISLYVDIGIRLLANVVLFFAGAFEITFVLSGALALLTYIIRAVKNYYSQASSQKPLREFKSLKIAKFSILAMLILMIAYTVLVFARRLTLNKLDTGSLTNYPDSEWVSEDGKIAISMSINFEGHLLYMEDTSMYDVIYEPNGICRIDNGQNTDEYDIYEGGIGRHKLSLVSSDDELKMRIYVYLLDGETFYAEICDDEDEDEFMGRIVKFYRVYE